MPSLEVVGVTARLLTPCPDLRPRQAAILDAVQQPARRFRPLRAADARYALN